MTAGPDRGRPAAAGFGAALRRHRIAARLTQEQLAERAGVSARSIRDMERGRVLYPRPDSVRLIALALRLPAAEAARLESLARRGYWAARDGALGAEAGAVGAEPGAVGAGAVLSPNAHPRPAQLPRDAADFTGRAALVDDLLARLSRTGGRPCPVVAVFGRPGVGKTALSIHVGHRLRGTLTDGQLYVGLRGGTHLPTDPGQALGHLLRGLGLDGSAIPKGLDERAAEYRTRTANRRLLIILDDARDEAQVRPLLPGGSECAVLITSRNRLTTLDGTDRVGLDVLGEEEALALLATIAGAERIAADPVAALDVVRYCGWLPLAIRVAAARLAADPAATPTGLASALSADQHRLGQLSAGDLDVASSIGGSYAGLAATERHTFRMLGLLDAPDVPAWVVSALTGLDAEVAARAVAGLVTANLVDDVGRDPAGQVRYRMHDLVRLFARERATAEATPGELAAAVLRAAGGWLTLAEVADRHLQCRRVSFPGKPPAWRPEPAVIDLAITHPQAWFEAERGALVAIAGQTAAAGRSEITWRLAAAAVGFLDLSAYLDDWGQLADHALRVSLAAGDRRGEAVSRYLLGELAGDWTRLGDAEVQLRTAAALFDEVGDRVGQGRALSGLGVYLDLAGDSRAAETSLRTALGCLDGAGEEIEQVQTLIRLGLILGRHGDQSEATACLDRAAEISSRHDYPYGEAWAVRMLARTHGRAGRLDLAIPLYERAVETYRRIGGTVGEAYTLIDLAEALTARLPAERDAAGDDDARIRAMLADCLATVDRLGDAYGTAMAREVVAALDRRAGDLAAAREQLDCCVAYWRSTGVRRRAAAALDMLGSVCQELGDAEAAQAAWAEAHHLHVALDTPDATKTR
ncbi:MAG TPA: helix-turn-helix domain-containing protein [Pilimelia sp.]|nr:helix-turn-helix domain-containing protein [Pilimelia sp.]